MLNGVGTIGASLGLAAAGIGEKKRSAFTHSCLNAIFSPRQARDKHR
eukprot:COSAG06_NODE_71172_length_187_cov_23.284091_1_plen_46_part_10